MRKRLRPSIGAGLVILLLAAALPSAALAQTETPTVLPTATPLATSTPTNTTAPTPTETVLPTSTPTLPATAVAAAATATPRVEATAAPTALPVTGDGGLAGALLGLLPMAALLLLAIPALGRLRRQGH